MIHWSSAPEMATRLLELNRQDDRPLPLWGLPHPNGTPCPCSNRSEEEPRSPSTRAAPQPAKEAIVPV